MLVVQLVGYSQPKKVWDFELQEFRNVSNGKYSEPRVRLGALTSNCQHASILFQSRLALIGSRNLKPGHSESTRNLRLLFIWPSLSRSYSFSNSYYSLAKGCNTYFSALPSFTSRQTPQSWLQAYKSCCPDVCTLLPRNISTAAFICLLFYILRLLDCCHSTFSSSSGPSDGLTRRNMSLSYAQTTRNVDHTKWALFYFLLLSGGLW
jgi:hypothetical protein